MDIRYCIAELLSLHDCVIIPGFGGFIGNYSPARIDPVHHSFQPPTKKLLFNINLKQNDGLLANAVAGSYGTTYSEACRLIDEFSDHLRFILKTGKPVILPEVGKLTAGEEGIIYFEQDQGANLLPDAFGLTPFISPPVIRHSGKKFMMPRAFKWAAVFIIPIGIATVIGVTQFDKLSPNFANNAGLLTSVFSRFSTASLIEKKSAPVNPVTKIIPVAVKIVTPHSEATIAPTIRYDDKYAVIVGAFRMKENAEKLVYDLQRKGIEASIFDQSKTGLFRVTIGTGSSRASANQLLATIKSPELAGAWVLAK